MELSPEFGGRHRTSQRKLNAYEEPTVEGKELSRCKCFPIRILCRAGKNILFLCPAIDLFQKVEDVRLHVMEECECGTSKQWCLRYNVKVACRNCRIYFVKLRDLEKHVRDLCSLFPPHKLLP